MIQLKTCCQEVFTGGYPPTRQCTNKCTVICNDKPYCGIHDPVARKAKQDARDAARRAENKRISDAYNANHQRHRAEAEACEGVPTEKLTKGLLARLLEETGI